MPTKLVGWKRWRSLSIAKEDSYGDGAVETTTLRTSSDPVDIIGDTQDNLDETSGKEEADNIDIYAFSTEGEHTTRCHPHDVAVLCSFLLGSSSSTGPDGDGFYTHTIVPKTNISADSFAMYEATGAGVMEVFGMGIDSVAINIARKSFMEISAVLRGNGEMEWSPFYYTLGDYAADNTVITPADALKVGSVFTPTYSLSEGGTNGVAVNNPSSTEPYLISGFCSVAREGTISSNVWSGGTAINTEIESLAITLNSNFEDDESYSFDKGLYRIRTNRTRRTFSISATLRVTSDSNWTKFDWSKLQNESSINLRIFCTDATSTYSVEILIPKIQFSIVPLSGGAADIIVENFEGPLMTDNDGTNSIIILVKNKNSEYLI